MKHKKQLRKAQDDRKHSSDTDPRSTENSSESEVNEKPAEELQGAPRPAAYLLHDDEDEDDVDIEEDICSPEHLL